MKIDPVYLAMITISYPILAAICFLAAGLNLADAIERRDPPRVLPSLAFVLFSVRFSILAVSLGELPAMLDRYTMQEIAAVLDTTAAVLALPFAAIILRRRHRAHKRHQEAGA